MNHNPEWKELDGVMAEKRELVERIAVLKAGGLPQALAPQKGVDPNVAAEREIQVRRYCGCYTHCHVYIYVFA